MMMNEDLQLKKLEEINKDVEKVQDYIDTVTRIKDEAITKLEKEKTILRRQIQSGTLTTRTSAEITNQIQCILSEYRHIMKKVEEKYDNIKQLKTDAQTIYEIIHELDIEIAQIQDEHNNKVYELENKQEELRKDIDDIEKLHMVFNTITLKLVEMQETFQAKLDDLEKERLIALHDENLTEEERAVILARLDKEIKQCKDEQNEVLYTLKEQRFNIETEAQRKITNVNESLEEIEKEKSLVKEEMAKRKFVHETQKLLEINYDSIPPRLHKEYADRLRERMELLAAHMRCCENPSDLDFYREAYRNAQKQLELLERNEVLANLRGRGLEMTLSGHLLSESGHYISIDEAIRKGYITSHDKLIVAKLLLSQQECPGSVEAFPSLTESDSLISSEDLHYLKSTIGKVLTLALAEISMKQPKDPIHYLAHWLIKYRYNQEVQESQRKEVEDLVEERNRILQKALHELIEDEAQKAVLDMIENAEKMVIKKALDAEMQKIIDNAAALEEQEEEENFASEARDVLGVYNGPPVNQKMR